MTDRQDNKEEKTWDMSEAVAYVSTLFLNALTVLEEKEQGGKQ